MKKEFRVILKIEIEKILESKNKAKKQQDTPPADGLELMASMKKYRLKGVK